jgi:hypothetical protein
MQNGVGGGLCNNDSEACALSYLVLQRICLSSMITALLVSRRIASADRWMWTIIVHTKHITSYIHVSSSGTYNAEYHRYASSNRTLTSYISPLMPVHSLLRPAFCTRPRQTDVHRRVRPRLTIVSSLVIVVPARSPQQFPRVIDPV